MRGQVALIGLRMNGLKPRCVFVDDVKIKLRGIFDAEIQAGETGIPEIHIEPGDNIATLDFRCLHGMTVAISGTDIDRLRAIFARVRHFKPEKIITSNGDFLHIWEPTQ